MGQYSDNHSIKTPCCTDKWAHNACLQNYALAAGLERTFCPLCKNEEDFRRHIMEHGVYVPVKDADWEAAGNDAFYNYTQVCISINV